MRRSLQISRRQFVTGCGFFSGSMLLNSVVGSANLLQGNSDGTDWHRFEARWYEKSPYKKVKCKLCPRECVVDDLERGYCGVRENWDGIYYSLVYSRPCTYHIDPIEKKPLFHFLPGTEAFSIATVGCNVNCKFCQNWQISQIRPEQAQSFDLPPEKVANLAKSEKTPSIAYTYSEPVVFSEYMMDTAIAGNREGIKSVMISNGYIQEQPMRDLAEVLAAVKIDLKAFTEKYYKDVVVGELKPVLDTLVLLKKLDIWTEIVYLVVPTLNDGDREFRELANWAVQYLGKEVPIHFTRFHPQYKLQNLPPTPQKTLERARQIALAAGLHYIYIGNIPGHEGEHTYCPGCKKRLIRRRGFLVEENLIASGGCPFCGQKIPGVWA